MAKFLSSKDRRPLEIGQSLVEMTVGFVILVMIMSGLLDLGRIYFVWVALEDAVGEGALYLSLNVDCGLETDDNLHITPDNSCDNPNNAMYRARYATEGVLDINAMEITVNNKTGTVFFGVGEEVKVTIRYPFQLITPIIPRIAGVNPIYLYVEATQVVITES